MSDIKTILPNQQWVELYTELSEYILERASLDAIYDDEGSLTPEKQEEFIEIANDVEEIISYAGLIRSNTNERLEGAKVIIDLPDGWTCVECGDEYLEDTEGQLVDDDTNGTLCKKCKEI